MTRRAKKEGEGARKGPLILYVKPPVQRPGNHGAFIHNLKSEAGEAVGLEGGHGSFRPWG